MITATKQNTITRRGVKSEGKFQIKATGKAFRILSDGLYSDKIKAIMRELSCNAYDAHVEAGNLDKPFDIHLPNKLEPTFKIRDYGVGLSHDDIINVYTTYFESTKTESNDYVGCLGLGSKSPFSYVDNFTIVSYFNGEKRIYSAFLNEDETPTIALLSESETTEPNGLEISFPVQVNDIYRFEEKAMSVFTYFKMRPNFTGAKPEIIETNYVLEGTNWGVRESNYDSARAVMGNIAYKLSDFSGDKFDMDNAVLSLMRSVPIDIYFNIGDLEVSASRESLSYNKMTIANIQSVLSKVVEEIRQNASAKIAQCNTLWDARVMLQNGEYSHLKSVFEGKDIFKYKDRTLSGGSYTKISHDLQTSGIEIMRFSPKLGWKYGHTNIKISRENTHIIYATKGTRMFHADITSGLHLRCKQVILESKDVEQNSRHDSYKEINNVYLVHGDEKAIKLFCEEMGVPSIPAISTIKKKKNSVVYKTAEYNPKNATRVLIYERNKRLHNPSKPSTYWRKGDVSFDEGGIYVNIDRYKIGNANPELYIRNLEEKISKVKENFENIQIVGVKNSMYSKFAESERWKTLKEYSSEMVSRYVEENDLLEKVNLAYELHNYEVRRGYLGQLVMDMKLSKDKPCGQFVARVKAMQARFKDNIDAQHFISLNGVLNYFQLNKTVDSVYNLDEEWKKVCKHYPLFEVLESWSIRDKKEAVKEYIDTLDKVK